VGKKIDFLRKEGVGLFTLLFYKENMEASVVFMLCGVKCDLLVQNISKKFISSSQCRTKIYSGKTKCLSFFSFWVW
jgi:hypothetical protein